MSYQQVVAPSSLRLNWRQEFTRWVPWLSKHNGNAPAEVLYSRLPTCRIGIRLDTFCSECPLTDDRPLVVQVVLNGKSVINPLDRSMKVQAQWNLKYVVQLLSCKLHSSCFTRVFRWHANRLICNNYSTRTTYILSFHNLTQVLVISYDLVGKMYSKLQEMQFQVMSLDLLRRINWWKIATSGLYSVRRNTARLHWALVVVPNAFRWLYAMNPTIWRIHKLSEQSPSSAC